MIGDFMIKNSWIKAWIAYDCLIWYNIFKESTKMFAVKSTRMLYKGKYFDQSHSRHCQYDNLGLITGF